MAVRFRDRGQKRAALRRWHASYRTIDAMEQEAPVAWVEEKESDGGNDGGAEWRLRAALHQWRRLARAWARLPADRTVERWGRRLRLRRGLRRWMAEHRQRRQMAAGAQQLRRLLLRQALRGWAQAAALRSAALRLLGTSQQVDLRRAWQRLRRAVATDWAARHIQRVWRRHFARRAAALEATTSTVATRLLVRRAWRAWREGVEARRAGRRAAALRLAAVVSNVVAARRRARAWGQWREAARAAVWEEAVEARAVAHAAAWLKARALRRWHVRAGVLRRQAEQEAWVGSAQWRRWRLQLALRRRMLPALERTALQAELVHEAEYHRRLRALTAWARRARRQREQQELQLELVALAEGQRARSLLRQWRRRRTIRQHVRARALLAIHSTRLLHRGLLALWRHRQEALRYAQTSLRQRADRHFLLVRGWRRLRAHAARRAQQRLLLGRSHQSLLASTVHGRPGRFLPAYRIRRVRSSYAYSREVAAAHGHARSLRDPSHDGVAAARAFIGERLWCALLPEQQDDEFSLSLSLSRSRGRGTARGAAVRLDAIPAAVLARLGEVWYLHRWLHRWRRRAAQGARAHRVAPRFHDGNLLAWGLSALFAQRKRRRHARLAWQAAEGYHTRRLMQWWEPRAQERRRRCQLQHRGQFGWQHDDNSDEEELGHSFSLCFSRTAPASPAFPLEEADAEEEAARRRLPFASPLSPSSSSSSSSSSLPPPPPAAAFLSTPLRALLATPRTGAGTSTRTAAAFSSTPRFVARIRQAFARRRQRQQEQTQEQEGEGEHAPPPSLPVPVPPDFASPPPQAPTSWEQEDEEEEQQPEPPLSVRRRQHYRRRFPPETVLVLRRVLAALEAGLQRGQRATAAAGASDVHRSRRALVAWHGRAHAAGMQARTLLMATAAGEQAAVARSWWWLRRRLGAQRLQELGLRAGMEAWASRWASAALGRLRLLARQQAFHRQAIVVQQQRAPRRRALVVLTGLRQRAAASLARLDLAARQRDHGRLHAALGRLRRAAAQRREQRALVGRAAAVHEALAASRGVTRWAQAARARALQRRRLVRAHAFYRRRHLLAPALRRWRHHSAVRRRFPPQRQAKRADVWRRRQQYLSALQRWHQRAALTARMRALGQRSHRRRTLLAWAGAAHRVRSLRSHGEALRCRRQLGTELRLFAAWKALASRRHRLRDAFLAVRAQAEQGRLHRVFGAWAAAARVRRRERQRAGRLAAQHARRTLSGAFYQWRVVALVSQHERAWAWARAQRALYLWLLQAQAGRWARRAEAKGVAWWALRAKAGAMAGWRRRVMQTGQGH